MKLDYYIERFELSFPDDFSRRQKELAIFEKIYNGTIYDNLPPFYCEYTTSNDNGEYIPLAQRRPSIKYKLAKVIVNELASMLFGESHFPAVRCGEVDHGDTTNYLQKITRVSNLRLTMLNAVKVGSVGSVAILVKYLEGNFCFEVLKTKYLKPTFDQFNETILINLQERKTFKGKDLKESGYNIPKDNLDKIYVLIREWNEYQELYYMPYLLEEEEEDNFSLKVDTDKSNGHKLGFVPVVWIKNPDSEGFDKIDGHCIFSDIIDIGIEIDYQLSQHGRLLKYNSDPTLVIRDPSRLADGQLIKGIGALTVGEGGDAKYLQLDSSATDAVLAYVDKLRQLAIEVVRGDRANPDKMLAGNSGKALQMLNKPMVSLVDELRISYGEIGLMNIYKMIYAISISPKIDMSMIKDFKVENDCEDHLILDWPAFYPSNERDKLDTANTLKTLVDSGNLSHKTAIATIADDYHITDQEEEIKEIAKDQAALQATLPKTTKVINA